MLVDTPPLNVAGASPELVEAMRVTGSRLLYSNYIRYFGFTPEGRFPLTHPQQRRPTWPYVLRLAELLDTDFDIVILKRRQTLVSWMLALYADWEARVHEEEWNVGVTSVGETDAAEFMSKLKKTTNRLPWHFFGERARHNEMSAWYPHNGNLVKAFPSTAHAGLGRTLSSFIMDEAAFHPNAETNYDFVYPSLYKARLHDKRRRGRIIIASTSHPKLGRSGFFYSQWLKACGTTVLRETNEIAWWPERESLAHWLKRRTAKPEVVPVFLSRWCRPDQPKEGPGSEWAGRERARMTHEDESFGGSAAFDTFYPETPEAAFAGREGLVFGRDQEDGTLIFDPDRNVVAAEVNWEKCDWRIVGIDPGGRDPAGIIGLGVTKAAGPPGGQSNHYLRRRHVYRSLSRKGSMSIDELDNLLHRWEKEAHITAIFIGETGGSTIVDTLRARGWPVFQATMDRGQISHVQSMFKTGLLTLEPGHVANGLMDEMGRLRWKDTGNAFATEISGPDHGDRIDALRYACAGVLRALPAAGDAAAIQPSQVGYGTFATRQVGYGGGRFTQVGR